MIQVKIKTDNIEVNVSEDGVIDTEDFLYSMKKIMDMVVEAEKDIAYNNQDEVWDTEKQSDIFNSIMSKSDLTGKALTQDPAQTIIEYIIDTFNKNEQSR